MSFNVKVSDAVSEIKAGDEEVVKPAEPAEMKLSMNHATARQKFQVNVITPHSHTVPEPD